MEEDPFDILNSIRRRQLSRVDFKEDADKVRRRKQWKENREEFLSDKDVCEWCGEEPERGFDVHHTWGKSFSRQWNKATDEAFIESDEYNTSLTEDRRECPECGLKNYYERKTKTPTYRCNCGAEFDKPNVVEGGQALADDDYDNKPYAGYEYYEAKAKWVRDNSEDVWERFQQRYQDLLDEYASLREDQVVAICRKCHYKEEQTRKRLCPVCESNWYDPKKGSDNMCWDCLVDEKGLEECPDCSNGWFQPSKYDACSSCR